MLYITDHGGQRARQRLGLPKRAVPRMVKRVLTQGQRLADFAPSIRCLLEDAVSTIHPQADPRVYGRHMWVFEGDRFVTCWVLPIEIRRLLR